MIAHNQTPTKAQYCEKCSILQLVKTCPRCGAACVEFSWGEEEREWQPPVNAKLEFRKRN